MTIATREDFYLDKEWERRRNVFRLLQIPCEGSEPKKDVARILRTALARADLTQAQLIEALYAVCEIEWDKGNVSRAFNGEQLPNTEKIEAITLVLNNLTNEEEAVLMALIPGYRPVCERYRLAWLRSVRAG
jgi:hypothetical protein